MEFYDSEGSLSTDLADAKAEDGHSLVNAVVAGEGWIFYTYSMAEEAAVIDYGGTLERTMDPSMAVD